MKSPHPPESVNLQKYHYVAWVLWPKYCSTQQSDIQFKRENICECPPPAVSSYLQQCRSDSEHQNASSDTGTERTAWRRKAGERVIRNRAWRFTIGTIAGPGCQYKIRFQFSLIGSARRWITPRNILNFTCGILTRSINASFGIRKSEIVHAILLA